ncbi:hypothetical protein AHF37_07386 [Paragonimus kellicotti]|nr:hypothetical protein AHF37_07386 [Paragonimus kellicotti]
MSIVVARTRVRLRDCEYSAPSFVVIKEDRLPLWMLSTTHTVMNKLSRTYLNYAALPQESVNKAFMILVTTWTTVLRLDYCTHPFI